jgi:hypothetical protein
VQWLKYYKTPDGKGVNKLVSDNPSSPTDAVSVIEACHSRWQALTTGVVQNTSGFALT